MRTDDFIRALSRDRVIEAPSGARRGLVLAILCALAVGTAFLGAIGPRANILQSIGPVAWKIVITGLVGVGGFVLTGRLGRPGATAGRLRCDRV